MPTILYDYFFLYLGIPIYFLRIIILYASTYLFVYMSIFPNTHLFFPTPTDFSVYPFFVQSYFHSYTHLFFCIFFFKLSFDQPHIVIAKPHIMYENIPLYFDNMTSVSTFSNRNVTINYPYTLWITAIQFFVNLPTFSNKLLST